MADGADPPKLSLRRRLAYSAVVVVVSLFVLELGLRAYYAWISSPQSRQRFALFEDEAAPRFRSHPYLSYALAPGFADDRSGTHHSALGFRGPSPRCAGTKGCWLVAALGASTTYGYRLSDEQTYPAQLERALRRLTGRPGIEVLNAGVPGYTSWESLGNLAFRVLELRPRVVIIYHAANDLHARRARAYRPDNTGYRRAWSLRWTPGLRVVRHCHLCRFLALRLTGLKLLGVEHYTQQADELAPELSPELLRAHGPGFFARNLRNMIVLARAHGAQVVLCTFATNPSFSDHYAARDGYRAGFAEMNQVLRGLASSEKVPLVDLDRLLPRQPDLWLDGVHLSAAGSARMAEELARALVAAGLAESASR